MLVVDDTAHLRVLLSKVLEASGYAVLDAADGNQALEMLREGRARPDLVFTDVEMPGMGGIDLIERIRRLDSPVADVPIVAASGNPEESLHRRVLLAGADRFLAKPFQVQDVRQTVAGLLKARRRHAGQRADNTVTSPAHRLDSDLGPINPN